MWGEPQPRTGFLNLTLHQRPLEACVPRPSSWRSGSGGPESLHFLQAPAGAAEPQTTQETSGLTAASRSLAQRWALRRGRDTRSQGTRNLGAR